MSDLALKPSLIAGLKGRDFLRLADFTPEELTHLLALAARIKAEPSAYATSLAGKSLGMIFTKSSTRTRVSFEVGMYQLGGQALFLSGNDIQIGRGEPISDTGRVLSRYLHGIMIRTFKQADVEALAQAASIPVINGLTDEYHPCQVLADLQTILEHKGSFEGRKLAYVGDGNNMAHSLLIGCAKVGMDVTVASPEGYQPDPVVVALAQATADGKSDVIVTTDFAAAVAGADVLYTDAWASMGQEAEHDARVKAFEGYCLDDRLTSLAKPDHIFMHCLPAYRGEEATAEVIDGPHSVIFDQAENRLHAQKAILVALMA